MNPGIPQNSEWISQPSSIDTIRTWRKNMLQKNDYIIDHGEIVNNHEANKNIVVQRSKLEMPKQFTPQKEGTIQFATFNGKGKLPEPRLKGYGG